MLMPIVLMPVAGVTALVAIFWRKLLEGSNLLFRRCSACEENTVTSGVVFFL